MRVSRAILNALLCATLSLVPLTASAGFSVFEKGSTNSAAISIIHSCDGSGPGGDPILLLGIWRNGRIVWSTKTNGVRSYFAATLDTNRIREVIQKFEKKGYFEDPKLSHLSLVPVDGWYYAVTVNDGDHSLNYQAYMDFTDATQEAVRELEQPPYSMGDQVVAWKLS